MLCIYIPNSFGVRIPPNVDYLVYEQLLIWGFPPQTPGGEVIALKRFRNRTPEQRKCK